MRSERGTITVMTIGFLLVLGLVTVVVVDATAAFLHRLNLNNLADGAALAAVDGIDERQFYEDRRVVLSQSDVESIVHRYLAGEPVSVAAITIRRDRVRVRLEQKVKLPIAPPSWIRDSVVVAEANAQIRSGR